MRTLITGGAGFIGSNLAATMARAGNVVILADNLSRSGSAENLRSLLADPQLAPRIAFRQVDVRDESACRALMAEQPVDAVVHLAGQVAVTGSVADPVKDFDVNARGTLNVLEAVRHAGSEAHVLLASTNKVYGSLADLPTERLPTRYILRDYPDGIPESYPADPATPYGCSKLAADAYVRDYAHTYALRTTVFRMSCIYGTRQNGTASQGWVSWFVRAALSGEDITIYGDGLQVRDLLHVDDLVHAMLTVLTTGKGTRETFNVGGGPMFSMSVWAEFGEILEDLLGYSIPVHYAERRLGDQDVYISDIRKAGDWLSWSPQTHPRDGVAQLMTWMRAKLDAEHPAKTRRKAVT